MSEKDNILTPEDVKELAPLYDAVILALKAGLRPGDSGKYLRPWTHLRAQHQQRARSVDSDDLHRTELPYGR